MLANKPTRFDRLSSNQHNPRCFPSIFIIRICLRLAMPIIKFVYTIPRLRLTLLLLLVAGFGAIASAQSERPLQSLNYRLAMSQPVSHLFEVTMEVELSGEATAKSLDFQMPRWSPGRYAVFDFAKNVQEFMAYKLNCAPRKDAPSALNCQFSSLPFERVDDQTWRGQTQGPPKAQLSDQVFGK